MDAMTVELQPPAEIAARLGLEPEEIQAYGRTAAKIELSAIDRLAGEPDGRIVSVTSMTPTKFGEGKTTTAISLVEAFGALGERSILCLREPSLGPVFGLKGGGTGGGRAQVVPMEEINLHFTGDIHAIGAANNLLAAMLDAHFLHGNELGIDPLSVSWRRCLDMDDRALRQVVIGLGGRPNGVPARDGLRHHRGLRGDGDRRRLARPRRPARTARRDHGRLDVRRQQPVTAEEIGAAGSMAVLLKEALKPNLVQTAEGQPALVHCGPFANIAHGNNSLVADRLALKLGDSSSPRAALAPTWDSRSSSISSAVLAGSLRASSCSSRRSRRSSTTAVTTTAASPRSSGAPRTCARTCKSSRRSASPV